MPTTEPYSTSPCSRLRGCQPDCLSRSMCNATPIPGNRISPGAISLTPDSVVTWVLSDDDRVRRAKSLLWTAILIGSISVAIVAIVAVALVSLLGVGVGTSAAAGIGAALVGRKVTAYRRRQDHTVQHRVP